MCRGPWENFPYYTGPCPNVDGCYRCGYVNDCDDNDDDGDDNERCRRRKRRKGGCQYDYDRCRCRDWDCDDDNDDEDDDNDCESERKCKRRCGRCGRGRRRGCMKPCCGMFICYPPLAVSANGIIPLANGIPCRKDSFDVNSGLITLEKAGTYLASYNVQVPGAVALDTTVTLNVENASQAPAAMEVITAEGDATSSFSAQAIFQADEGDTVSLRTTDAINATDTAAQPIFTLSLVRIGD